MAKSPLTQFYLNFKNFFVLKNKQLYQHFQLESVDSEKQPAFDSAEVFNQKAELITNLFAESRILTKSSDKLVAYFCLPSFVQKARLVPAQIFPRSKSERFPEASAIMSWFDSQPQKSIPNLILLELELVGKD